MIEASGMADAVAKVRAEGVFPSAVEEPKPGPRFFWRIDDTALPGITRQLSSLCSAGVPLLDALSSVAAELNGPMRDMLVALKERVASGAGLSRALEDFPDIFPDFYRSMISAGEEGGNLDLVLGKLADFLERQQAIRAKVRTAAIYPVFMVGVSVVVLSFLFTFVIPKIVKIFRDSHAALPFITVVLITLSNIFVKYWWLLAGAAAALFLGGRRFIRNRRRLADRLLLRLPGRIMQSLVYARFSRTLGFLLGGGMPLLRALPLAGRSAGNREIEAEVLDAAGRVAEGQSLSASLGSFPPVFLQLVSTGEKSGRLPEMLGRAADSYEEEFNRKVAQALSLFEPAMILAMGAAVLFIVLAVLLPMFQLNQLVK